jgi:hypothetical protein
LARGYDGAANIKISSEILSGGGIKVGYNGAKWGGEDLNQRYEATEEPPRDMICTRAYQI